MPETAYSRGCITTKSTIEAMRIFGILVVAIGLIGCDLTDTQNSDTDFNTYELSTSVTGKTMASPTNPIVTEEDGPGFMMISAEIELLDSEGNQVSTTTSTADGTFVLPAAEGTFTLRSVNPIGLSGISAPGFPRSPDPMVIEVGPSGITDIEFIFDTGIR